MINSQALCEDIERCIVGKPITEIKSVSGDIWICFGEQVHINMEDGKSRARREGMFRIQCPYRICKNEKILFGSRDIHSFVTNADKTGLLPGVRQVSVLDNEIDQFNRNCLQSRAISVEVDLSYSIKIECEEGISIELFVNSSRRDIEYWRFMSYKPSEAKYVIYPV